MCLHMRLFEKFKNIWISKSENLKRTLGTLNMTSNKKIINYKVVDHVDLYKFSIIDQVNIQFLIF